MNIELNPLSDYDTHTVFHILVAFQYSDDAYAYSDKLANVGPKGTRFNSGCGSAIVIVNEGKGSETAIDKAQSTWNFFSPTNFRTTSYVGNMEIVDRSGFFFTQSLKEFTNDLGMTMAHLTFAWLPIFRGKRNNSPETTDIKINPLFFHVTKFTQNITPTEGRSYFIDFAACYNTHGISPQFNTFQGITVNHKDANTIGTQPVSTAPSSGLQPLNIEDKNKLQPRKKRLEKIKYIKTIDEFCKSYEIALNKQINDHNMQLQTFISMINESHTKHLSNMNSEKIPLIYKIKVDDYYKPKKIDNVNLPFEQIEINQKKFGISTITFPLSYTIHSSLACIFKSSSEIGIDHSKQKINTYKFTTTTSRTCDSKYLIHTKINKYISPKNSIYSGDTGPGNNLISGPIQYTYQDKNAKDNTVVSITYGAAPHFELKTIEQSNIEDDADVILGDREIQSLKRKNDGSSGFFDNAFSGLRSSRATFIDNGLQNSTSANSISAFNPLQQTTYTINILGNPSLLNDINRNPNDVISDNIGNAIIYSNIEYEPIYIKLKIYLRGDRRDDDNTDNIFYYDGYLHVYKIINVFTPGSYSQTIYCSRTDEKDLI